MARVQFGLLVLLCVFAYSFSNEANSDNDFAKSFVNHFQHSLNKLQEENTRRVMKAASLFSDLVNTDAEPQTANHVATDEAKDVKRNEIYKHLVQNGGIQTDFTKPSIGFILEVFENLLDGQGIDSAVGYKNAEDVGRKTVDSDTIRSFTAKRYKDNMAIAQVPPLPGHEKITLAEIRYLGNEKSTKQITVALRRNDQNLIKIKVKPAKNGISVIPESFVSILNRFHGNVSVVLREKTNRRRSDIIDNAPIVVIYSSDQGFMKGVYKSYTSSVTNDINGIRSTRRRRSTRNNDGKKSNRKKDKWVSRERKPCKLHDFNVDFDLIGWGPWIIHPKKFNARACHGQCPSPLGPEYSPTNHAMLQTLMKMKRPRSAPEPCCVPTKLNPLSMLYFEYDDIVVRHHEGMITSECGCR